MYINHLRISSPWIQTDINEKINQHFRKWKRIYQNLACIKIKFHYNVLEFHLFTLVSNKVELWWKKKSNLNPDGFLPLVDQVQATPSEMEHCSHWHTTSLRTAGKTRPLTDWWTGLQLSDSGLSWWPNSVSLASCKLYTSSHNTKQEKMWQGE